MSEQRKDNSEQQLENLLAILANTDDSFTTPPAQDLPTQVTKDKSNQTNESDLDNLSSSTKLNLEKTEQDKNIDQQIDQEFEVLQQLLGKSEIEKLKDRVSSLEAKSDKLTREKEELAKKCNQLENRVEQQSNLISNQTKAFSQILTQNLAQLKQDVLIEIAIMLEKFVEDNIQQEQKFSIKIASVPEK